MDLPRCCVDQAEIGQPGESHAVLDPLLHFGFHAREAIAGRGQFYNEVRAKRQETALLLLAERVRTLLKSPRCIRSECGAARKYIPCGVKRPAPADAPCQGSELEV